MRSEINGVWFLRPAEKGIFEPYILLTDGNLEPRLDPFTNLYVAFAEPTRGGPSIAAAVSAELMGLPGQKRPEWA